MAGPAAQVAATAQGVALLLPIPPAVTGLTVIAPIVPPMMATYSRVPNRAIQRGRAC